LTAILATRAVRLGEADIVVAGGMESMSRAPYALPRAREGYRMGHGQLLDVMIHDGLWDPYNDIHMGNAGDLCAREHERRLGSHHSTRARARRAVRLSGWRSLRGRRWRR
jgi:acetyl-CoA acetyltransferase